MVRGASPLGAARLDVAKLYDAHRALLDGIVSTPGGIGWRAVAELAGLVDGARRYDRAEVTGDDFDASS